jgi:hypothetical protein
MLSKFLQKQHGKLCRFCRKKLQVKEFVRFGIDGSVQPAALIIHLNRCLNNHDVIGGASLVRCNSAFCTSYRWRFESVCHPTFQDTIGIQ